MPVQTNVGAQVAGTIAWDGTNSPHQDIRKFTVFGWSFEVTADLANDAVFNVEYADPSDADNCVPDAFQPVPEVAICSDGAAPGPQASIIVPAGTIAGTVCAGTVPCRSGAFYRIVPASGDTDSVNVVFLRKGPQIA